MLLIIKVKYIVIVLNILCSSELDVDLVMSFLVMVKV